MAGQTNIYYNEAYYEMSNKANYIKRFQFVRRYFVLLITLHYLKINRFCARESSHWSNLLLSIWFNLHETPKAHAKHRLDCCFLILIHYVLSSPCNATLFNRYISNGMHCETTNKIYRRLYYKPCNYRIFSFVTLNHTGKLYNHTSNIIFSINC